MSALLTDKTTAEPLSAGLHRSWVGLLNTVQQTLSALFARHLRRKAKLITLHHRLIKDAGLDRSEIGSLLITRESTNCVRQQRWHAATRN